MKKTKLDPIEKKALKFPDSLYPLKGAPIEWWYFTGHLKSEDKKNPQEFGYEFCIFKVNPAVVKFGPIHLDYFKKNPFLTLHFSITDKKNKKFHFYDGHGIKEKTKISFNKLNLSTGDSKIVLNNKNFLIRTKNELAELKLNLKPAKKMVKHFDGGYTVMYDSPEFRTYYLSFTRLLSSGYLKINGEKYKVSGKTWFDHQKLNLPLKYPLTGWDWFGIMLEDNTELMIFDIRGQRKNKKVLAGGTYIDKNSKKINLDSSDFKLKILSKWKNPKTKVTYPSSWRLEVPKLKLDLKIKPIVKSQELGRTIRIPFSYWEGACQVEGVKGKKKIRGESYVELIGYDKSLLAKIVQRLS